MSSNVDSIHPKIQAQSMRPEVAKGDCKMFLDKQNKSMLQENTGKENTKLKLCGNL